MARKFKRRPVVLKRVRFQTGRSNVSVDRKLGALAPGKRRSKRGKKYYETRQNRSDLRGRI